MLWFGLVGWLDLFLQACASNTHFSFESVLIRDTDPGYIVVTCKQVWNVLH